MVSRLRRWQKSSTFALKIGMSKHICYMAPVDWLVGNISGNQQIGYGEEKTAGYAIPDGVKESAVDYKPRMIAKRIWKSNRRYFQIRTRTTVNMTAGVRNTIALMGGAGALYSSLVRDKSTAIYKACSAACPKSTTLRAFIIPLLRAGLAAKNQTIAIADGVGIVNPWVNSAAPNVPVSAEILEKFNSVLSNS